MRVLFEFLKESLCVVGTVCAIGIYMYMVYYGMSQTTKQQYIICGTTNPNM